MFKIKKKDIRKNLTLSNILSLFRLLASTVIPVLYFILSKDIFIVYCGIVAFTDAADGYLARKLHQKTKLGKYLDPIADRFYALMIFFTLTITAVASPVILILTISREIFSLPSLLYSKIRKKKIIPNAGKIGKITTNLQFITFGLLILAGGSIVTLVFVVATFIFGTLSAVVYTQKTGLNTFCHSALKRLNLL